MCRVYRGKAGDYVRLCCRKGSRCGERIHFVGDPPIRASGCAGLFGVRTKTIRRKRKEAKRCLACGSTVISQREEVKTCSLCSSQNDPSMV